jgi:hypothetical protein
VLLLIALCPELPVQRPLGSVAHFSQCHDLQTPTLSNDSSLQRVHEVEDTTKGWWRLLYSCEKCCVRAKIVLRWGLWCRNR